MISSRWLSKYTNFFPPREKMFGPYLQQLQDQNDRKKSHKCVRRFNIVLEHEAKISVKLVRSST